MKETLPIRVRLGDFELDARTGELCDGERTVILQEQPFQVLLMLVNARGEAVTRDEIQKKLWPNDTVVEFDQGINAAIKRLRKALGDSSDNPKYIGTVARRGYRLLVPVEPLQVDEKSAAPGKLGPRTESRQNDSRNTLLGKKVSHYRVLNIIGGGGMGLVYEAEDLRLGRRVALKFLPEELARDTTALRRFEREAQTSSSLNHPNICTIYEVEEHEDQPFIVMELLEGETLRDSLAKAQGNPMALNQVLDVGIQTCNGLQTAHQKGIIHRDIKPANIFLTRFGQTKILDFGLAKAVDFTTRENEETAVACAAAAPEAGEAAAPQLARSAPDQATLTRLGVALGTAGYMSPEQVRGEKLDARTDLFSCGLVLYEMATGQRAFAAETAAVAQDAILHQTPTAARERNAAIPPGLEVIINRAIEKDRDRRYQSAAELRKDLEVLADESEEAQTRTRLVHFRWKWVFAIVAVCVALIAVELYWRSHRAPKLTEQDTIVIGDFDNTTGDPVFDDTLKQALTIQLEQSPFLSVLSGRKLSDTLKLMGRPTSQSLTRDVAREVCLRSGSKAVLTGSIAHLGSQYQIALDVVGCELGERLAEIQERATGKQEVLSALDKATITLRGRLGESLASVEKYATPLEEATTPSLEALRAYSIASKTKLTESTRAAIPIYERAVELDPSFAMAFSRLAVLYRNVNQGERAELCARKAYALRQKVSERERLAIEADYFDHVTGELDKAAETYERWQQSYPRDYRPVASLGGIYWRLGNMEKCLEKYRAAMRLEPNAYSSYENLSGAYENLNRLDEAEEVFKQAEQRKLGTAGIYLDWYSLAFLKGNDAQMEKMAAAARAEPNIDGPLLGTLAGTEAWHGKIKNARKLGREAIGFAERDGSAAIYLAMQALTQAPIVTSQQTRTDAEAALRASQDPSIRAPAALALALAGDVAKAERVAAELYRTNPLSTEIQDYWLPTIGAAVALQSRDPHRALDVLNKTSAIELGQSCLCSAYLRGKAYLMLTEGKAAATEFQKYIDHYGLVGSFTWGVLSRLELARAYALEAQTDPAYREKARTAYQDFLTLWKDADPDIPVYRQAKADYAKVQ